MVEVRSNTSILSILKYIDISKIPWSYHHVSISDMTHTFFSNFYSTLTLYVIVQHLKLKQKKKFFHI